MTALRREDRARINREARRVLGSGFAVCNVGLCWAEEGFDGEVRYGDHNLTYDFARSSDLYDNSERLRDFKLPAGGWTGTLDVWVYSYGSVGELRRGHEELEFNLYARFEGGRLVSVSAGYPR